MKFQAHTEGTNEHIIIELDGREILAGWYATRLSRMDGKNKKPYYPFTCSTGMHRPHPQHHHWLLRVRAETGKLGQTQEEEEKEQEQ